MNTMDFPDDFSLVSNILQEDDYFTSNHHHHLGHFNNDDDIFLNPDAAADGQSSTLNGRVSDMDASGSDCIVDVPILPAIEEAPVPVEEVASVSTKPELIINLRLNKHARAFDRLKKVLELSQIGTALTIPTSSTSSTDNTVHIPISPASTNSIPTSSVSYPSYPMLADYVSKAFKSPLNNSGQPDPTPLPILLAASPHAREKMNLATVTFQREWEAQVMEKKRFIDTTLRADLEVSSSDESGGEEGEEMDDVSLLSIQPIATGSRRDSGDSGVGSESASKIRVAKVLFPKSGSKQEFGAVCSNAQLSELKKAKSAVEPSQITPMRVQTKKLPVSTSRSKKKHRLTSLEDTDSESVASSFEQPPQKMAKKHRAPSRPSVPVKKPAANSSVPSTSASPIVSKSQCPHCPYDSKKSGHLKRHITCHLESRKFRCRECSYSSNFNFAVSKHEIIHYTGPKSKKIMPTPKRSKNAAKLSSSKKAAVRKLLSKKFSFVDVNQDEDDSSSVSSDSTINLDKAESDDDLPVVKRTAEEKVQLLLSLFAFGGCSASGKGDLQ